MPALARTLAARLAAAALALALTGAPGLAGLYAPAPEHRCGCREAGRPHDCACPRCHAAASARRAAEERSPPCHRAAPGTPAPAPPRDPDAACWKGSCGAADPGAPSPWAIEAFTLPGATALAPPASSGDVISRALRASGLVLSPEPPRPRGA